MRTKSKEQVRAEQELEALRAERIHVAKSDTEGKDERHRLAIVLFFLLLLVIILFCFSVLFC